MSLVAEGVAFAWSKGAGPGPVSFSLGPGTWRLVGGNGAGKTTLLRVLGGDLRPDHGRVLVEGEDVHRVDRARRHLGWSPAEPDLADHLTVDEAWALMAALRGAPGWDGGAARRELGLPGHARLATLSSGQRRAAELLAALAADPAVLLLDEPFAPLDVRVLGVVRGWFARWRASRVVVFTHHGDPGVPVDGTIEL